MDKRPLGVFDSGLGGLSAVKAILKYLPQEDIVYFGDTGRVPYGTRSEKTIELYAKEDIAFLEKFNCKLIMAACGTVSSVAKNAVASVKEPFVEVVSPACAAAVKATKNKRIGVMGTSATINSGSYVKKIKQLDPEIEVVGVSCPMLVSLVESNWIDSNDIIAIEMVKRYVKPLTDKKVDTIILGCTHFPHLSPVIKKVVGESVTLIDTGYEAVMRAKAVLQENGLLNEPSHKGESSYYISDRTQNFSETAKTLLGEDISDKANFIDINKFEKELTSKGYE